MAEVNDIIKATLFYDMPNASVPNNVFKWSLGNLPTDDADVMDAIEAWVNGIWGFNWIDIAPSSASLVSAAVDIINGDGTVAKNLGTIPFSLVGNAGAESLPAANSAYLLAQTEVPTKRGSKYIPCISETAVANGQLTTAAINALSLMLLGYLGNIQVPGAGKLFPGIISVATGTFTAFNATGSVEDIPAYQRRRKPNVGS